MSDTSRNPSRPTTAVWLTLGLCAVSATVFPYIAFASVVAVIVVGLAQGGRPRWWPVVGGILAVVATVRFTVEFAVPNIVSAGQRSAEEKSVSRLREILWAEDKIKEQQRVDRNGDGKFEYGFVADLLDQRADGLGIPILKPVMYRPLPKDAQGNTHVTAEGYVYTVYLPAKGGGWAAETGAEVDPVSSEKRYLAYAWPMVSKQGGNRVFVMDEREVICESANTEQLYFGVGKVPPATAALSPGSAVLSCGVGGDGATWVPWGKPWHKKQAREAP